MNYRVKKNKLLFTPYFVNNNFFKKARKINNNTLNVLYVGKFISRKRPLDILKVAKTLENYKDIKFTFVGSGPLLLNCQKWARKNFLFNVNFKGFQNQRQIKKIYVNSHILVNSSSYETWGLVVNEAMSVGLPCIITNKTGCAVDLIREGKTGYTYEVNDLISLKKYILRIYNNKKLYLKMSSNSKDIVKEYNVNNTVKAICRLI